MTGRLRDENARLNSIAGNKEAWATSTDYFKTYVEFRGKIVARVDWQAYATWDSGKLWNKVSDLNYQVTHVGTDPGKRADAHKKVLDFKVREMLQKQRIRIERPFQIPRELQ
jgi:hypothetical protein